MTVNATQTWVQYPGNGASTVFNIPFLITAATDLVVGFIAGGTYTQQSTGFTLQVVYPGAGTVTFAIAPPTGTTVDLRSLLPETQPTNFSNLGGYYPESTTNSMDRNTRLIQDLYRLTYQFGIHGPDSESVFWPALPNAAARAGGALVFDPVTGLPTLGVLTATPLTQSAFNGFLSSSNLGSILQPITNGEVAIGATIVNPYLKAGTPERYCANVIPGTTPMAANGFSVAVAAQMNNGGGEVNVGPGPYYMEAPVNCTWGLGGGAPPIVFNFTAGGAHGQLTGCVLYHNSIGFDCTGNDTIQFKFPLITTPVPATVTPQIGILFARNSTKASLINRVTHPNIVGCFSICGIYNYGAENFTIDCGYVGNFSLFSNTATRIYTANNVTGAGPVASAFLNDPMGNPVSIASGVVSMTVMDDIAMSDANFAGTSSSDLVRLEEVQSYNSHGGWGACPGGRSMRYIDQTFGPSSSCGIYGFHSEHISPLPQYGILWGAYTPTVIAPVAISTGWRITGCRLETGTRAIACLDANSALDGLVLDPVGELSSLGLSVPGTIQGDSVLHVGGMVLNIGSITAGTLLAGLQANWNITSNAATVINTLSQQVAGFGTPTGATLTTNFPGSSATLAQTSGMVAEMLNLMKSRGWILA